MQAVERWNIPAFTLPAAFSRIGRALPQWPHAVSLTVGLNICKKMGLLPVERVDELEGKHFRVSVLDSGGTADFTVRNGRFQPLFGAPASAAPDLHFSANLAAYLQLLTRQEDPDTLFFNRQLTIEGDTELGLRVKNMLDAVDWSRLPLPGAVKQRLGLV